MPYQTLRVKTYTFSELRQLLRTPVGRWVVRRAVTNRAWPILRVLARHYRRWCLRQTCVIAVVGSYGKTTTTRATIAALGEDPSRRHRSNALAQVALALLKTSPRDRYRVLEVGIDGPGLMKHHARTVGPDLVVVTSIGSEHHRSLGTLEVTRDEKAYMVRSLGEEGIAVLNGDDPNVAWMRSQTQARIVTFGRNPDNDVILSDIRLAWPTGMRFRARAGAEEQEMAVRLLGLPMVYAAGAAVATAWSLGHPIDRIGQRLSRLAPTPGRLEKIELGNGAIMIRDDVKSSLETVDAALDLLGEIPARRKLVVMGDISEPPGSQGPIYRRIGQRMAETASLLVVVGGGHQRFAAGARRGGLSGEAVIDAKRSIRAAVDAIDTALQPGDVVLVKGRDTQKLERVALSLMGADCRCDIPFCDAKIRCDACPMLGRGWEDRKAVS